MLRENGNGSYTQGVIISHKISMTWVRRVRSRKCLRYEQYKYLLMTQMPAPFFPATFKNFAAAYRTLAGEEAVLSFALPLGWLVLSPS